MLEPWIHFTVVIVTQFILLTICAYYLKRLPDIPRLLGWGVVIGVVFGIPFDLIAGIYFGIHSYTLGFDAYFLILNAMLSYGIFAAHVGMLQRTSWPHFIIWVVLIVAIYEVTNYFYPVWNWEFSLPSILFIALIFLGYFVGAVVGIFVWRAIDRAKFVI